MKTFYEIHCSSGVICSGGSDDFLVAILKAKLAKQRYQLQHPHSQFRVQLRYPNGYRVASVDVKSALRALENSAVLAFVTKRMTAADTRSVAADVDASLAGTAGAGFSQAGVVAPPDSLTGETRPDIWKGKLKGRFFVKPEAPIGL